MIPNLMSVLYNWTEPTQMKRLKKLVSNFEVNEQVQAVETFEGLLTAMTEQKVNRKPENERDWMWWSMWSTFELQLDDLVQDDRDRVFRVGSRRDWSKAGFYEYDLTETPPDA